jgi:hypothetical protein
LASTIGRASRTSGIRRTGRRVRGDHRPQLEERAVVGSAAVATGTGETDDQRQEYGAH